MGAEYLGSVMRDVSQNEIGKECLIWLQFHPDMIKNKQLCAIKVNKLKKM